MKNFITRSARIVGIKRIRPKYLQINKNVMG